MNEVGNEIDQVKQSMSFFTHWFNQNKDMIIDYVVQLGIAIIILIAGIILARIVSKILNKIMEVRNLDITVSQFLSSMARYTIITFTIIAALGHIGIQTTSLIAVLGAAGLAIGLALQGSLSNFAAGVLLVMFRPFRAGEYVDLGGIEGTVRGIQIFSTKLHSTDGKVIVVPNGKVIANNIINYSRNPHRRLQIMVSVCYESDIDQVKRVLTAVIDADKRILHEKGVTVRLNEMAASSLNYVVRVWTKNADYAVVNFDLLENFKRALDKNNIKLPFPQLEVYMHNAVNSDNKILD